MSQLVGQNCIVCGERLGWELEAQFCKGCSKPRHNSCVVEEAKRPDDCCSVCGYAPPPPPPPPTAFEIAEKEEQARATVGREWLKEGVIVFAGAFLVGAYFGFRMYFDHSPEAGVGLAAFCWLVGFGYLLRNLFTYRRVRRQAQAQEDWMRSRRK